MVDELRASIEEVGASAEIAGSLGASAALETVVNADEFQIKQLFLNILENALKYRREDVSPVVRISVRHYGDELMRRKTDRGTCKIVVQDNGIGFDPKHAAIMFEPFRRLVASSRFAGSGIGLATAKKVIERRHGAIEAHCKKGEGAAIMVTFPMFKG